MEWPAVMDIDDAQERAVALVHAVARGSNSAALRVLRAVPGAASSAEVLVRRGVALADARRVVALEAGFASWPLLRRALDVRALREADAEQALINAALAGDDARTDAILRRWPTLPELSCAAALLVGDTHAADSWSDATVNQPLAPTGWPPLLCLLNARYRAGDPALNAARLAIADGLIAAGADVNAGLPEAETIRGYRTALGAAVGRVRSAALARRLLDAGADIADGPTLYEGSAMWEAVRWRDRESLEALLDAAPPQWHVCHALPHALRFNDAALAKLLLGHGGDPNWSMGAWGFKGTCLHEAVVLDNDPALAEALLGHGANVDQPDRDGRTPLALAVCLNRKALAAVLRRHGAKEARLRPVDRWVSACFAGDGDAARRLATRHAGAPDAVATLHRSSTSADERAEARSHLAPWFRPADHLWLCRAIARRAPQAPAALRTPPPGVIPLLLAGGLHPYAADDDGERPLHLAAGAGDAAALAALLAAGADAKAVNFAGQTPLDVALDAGEDGSAETLARQGGDATSDLSDPGAVDAFERAADAVVNGDLDTLEQLLRERPRLATARSRRPHRCTLLHYLGANGFEGWRQKTPANAVDVIDRLIAAGSDPNAVCYTYRGGPGEHTAGLLASSGHPRAAGLTLAMLSALARGGMRQDPVYALLTALHEGRGAGRLAEAAAQVDAESEAARLAFVESAMLGEADLAVALLDAGVDVNTRRGDGATALHQAAFDGNADLVDTLIARGADPSLRDNVFDGNAAGWAHAGGHETLGKALAARLQTTGRQ